MERSKIKILIIATLMHSESIVKEKKKKKTRGIHHNRDVPTHALMFVNLEW